MQNLPLIPPRYARRSMSSSSRTSRRIPRLRKSVMSRLLATALRHVTGLPGCMANELLTFEDGTLGLAFT